MTLYHIQCSYAAIYSRRETVEASSPEEACQKAIEQSNGSAVWDSSSSDVGDTFVDAISDDPSGDPWKGDTKPVPVPYLEKPGDELIRKLFQTFPQFATDEEVDGGDLVEYVGQLFKDAQEAGVLPKQGA